MMTKEKIESAKMIDERTAIARNMHDEWRIVNRDKLGIAYIRTEGVPVMTTVTVPLDDGETPVIRQFFSESNAREYCADIGLEVK